MNNRILFLTVLGAGLLKSGCQHHPVLVRALPLGCRGLTWQRAERGNKLSPVSYKVTNPIHGCFTPVSSSNPNYLPKAVLPNILGARVSIYECQEGTNIQSIIVGLFCTLSKMDCEERRIFSHWQGLLGLLQRSRVICKMDICP